MNPQNNSLKSATNLKLTSLIEYGVESVVSRTIHKSDNVTMTIFAFDEGQELSEHTAPFNAYVQVIDGEVELTIGGNAILTKTGEITLMPANVPHAVKAVSRFKMLLTMIR